MPFFGYLSIRKPKEISESGNMLSDPGRLFAKSFRQAGANGGGRGRCFCGEFNLCRKMGHHRQRRCRFVRRRAVWNPRLCVAGALPTPSGQYGSV